MDNETIDLLRNHVQINAGWSIQKAGLVAVTEYLNQAFLNGDHADIPTEFIAKIAYYVKRSSNDPVAHNIARQFIEAMLADNRDYDILPMESLMERLA